MQGALADATRACASPSCRRVPRAARLRAMQTDIESTIDTLLAQFAPQEILDALLKRLEAKRAITSATAVRLAGVLPTTPPDGG